MLRDPRAEVRALRDGSWGSSLEKGTTSSWMTLARTVQLERGFFRGPRISSANKKKGKFTIEDIREDS